MATLARVMIKGLPKAMIKGATKVVTKAATKAVIKVATKAGTKAGTKAVIKMVIRPMQIKKKRKMTVAAKACVAILYSPYSCHSWRSAFCRRQPVECGFETPAPDRILSLCSLARD